MIALITLAEGLSIATLASVALAGVVFGVRLGKIETRLEVLPNVVASVQTERDERHKLEIKVEAHVSNPAAHHEAPAN